MFRQRKQKIDCKTSNQRQKQYDASLCSKRHNCSIHMNDSIPSPQNILNIPFECYLPSEIDLRSEITLMVTRTLCQIVPAFHCQENEVNWKIDHPYSKVFTKE